MASDAAMHARDVPRWGGLVGRVGYRLGEAPSPMHPPFRTLVLIDRSSLETIHLKELITTKRIMLELYK